MKIFPIGTELFRADRQTDMTKLIVAFCNFANAPKNGMHKALSTWTIDIPRGADIISNFLSRFSWVAFDVFYNALTYSGRNLVNLLWSFYVILQQTAIVSLHRLDIVFFLMENLCVTEEGNECKVFFGRSVFAKTVTVPKKYDIGIWRSVFICQH
jgi:hypothetical protein